MARDTSRHDNGVPKEGHCLDCGQTVLIHSNRQLVSHYRPGTDEFCFASDWIPLSVKRQMDEDAHADALYYEQLEAEANGSKS